MRGENPESVLSGGGAFLDDALGAGFKWLQVLDQELLQQEAEKDSIDPADVHYVVVAFLEGLRAFNN